MNKKREYKYSIPEYYGLLRSYRKLKARRNKYFCQNCKDQSWVIECQCLDPDCHEIITRFDRWHTQRSTIKGHYLKRRQSHRKADGWINKNGYRMIWIFDEETKKLRRVQEHRYIYEQYHNVKLTAEDVIHHKDGNKLNNDVKNLEKTNFPDHSRDHNTKDMSDRVCLLCNSKETYIDPNGWARWTHYNYGYICKKCDTKLYNNSHIYK